MNRTELKEKAKQSLNGKYSDAISLLLIILEISVTSCFVVGFMDYNENTTSAIGDLVSFIISALTEFGILSYFLKISRNQESNYMNYLEKANMFLDYIGISLVVGLFTLLWSLLFIIPGIIAVISYSLAYYIKLDNPELEVVDVIRKTKEMM